MALAGPVSRARRYYSVPPDQAALSKLPEIDPSKLELSNTSSPKDLVPDEELVFGRTFTGLPTYLAFVGDWNFC